MSDVALNFAVTLPTRPASIPVSTQPPSTSISEKKKKKKSDKKKNKNKRRRRVKLSKFRDLQVDLEQRSTTNVSKYSGKSKKWQKILGRAGSFDDNLESELEKNPIFKLKDHQIHILSSEYIRSRNVCKGFKTTILTPNQGTIFRKSVKKGNFEKLPYLLFRKFSRIREFPAHF